MIRLKAFCRSIIPQKQLTFIIIATKTNVNVILTGKTAKARGANLQTKKSESSYLSNT